MYAGGLVTMMMPMMPMTIMMMTAEAERMGIAIESRWC
jgi:hypothetical protein